MGNSRLSNLDDALVARFSQEAVLAAAGPCRPRILVVADGALNFNPNSGFGLTCFLDAIAGRNAGTTTKPILTLAYRGATHNPPGVAIGFETHTILLSYNFATGATAVNLNNYDQVWLFGFNAGAFTLTNNELAALCAFMNGGGGVFATGDHAALGRQLSGGLPRIRHMREWANIPMGAEVPSTAVNRIDTVVDPGLNNLYEFDDQSDAIPQRIYPSYKVTGATNATWQATVHPLLMLPGAVAVRTNNTGFTKDVDVLPDHPHESVCYATAPGVVAGTYVLQGQNFEEYRPSVANPAVRIAAELVAYAVSGGRSVQAPGTSFWKPPVRPQMFGVISAYDGRLAQSYPGQTQRPGRIVCDSTWHHYVNVNLDGTGSVTLRTGLGLFHPDGSFDPGPHLLKIFSYYRNIVSWLQPANRVTCQFFWQAVAIASQPMFVEEFASLQNTGSWDEIVALGRTALQILEATEGSAALEETVAAVLGNAGRTEAATLLVTKQFEERPADTTELAVGILGSAVIKAAQLFPFDDAKAAKASLGRSVDKNANEVLKETLRATKLGFEEKVRRAERTVSVFSALQ